jgi:hypothetical protein
MRLWLRQNKSLLGSESYSIKKANYLITRKTKIRVFFIYLFIIKIVANIIRKARSRRYIAVQIKVYKYKVVSTNFNDDIYCIEIIYLEERLHLLVNILAIGSLVRWCCTSSHLLCRLWGYYGAKRPLVLDVIYSKISIKKILAR